MSFIIKVDDFLAIAKKDHEFFLATKLVFLFEIHEGVGISLVTLTINICAFNGYNTNYINNRNSLTKVHVSPCSPPSFSNASLLVILPIINSLKYVRVAFRKF
jgi:hypothetical protein